MVPGFFVLIFLIWLSQMTFGSIRRWGERVSLKEEELREVIGLQNLCSFIISSASHIYEQRSDLACWAFRHTKLRRKWSKASPLSGDKEVFKRSERKNQTRMFSLTGPHNKSQECHGQSAWFVWARPSPYPPCWWGQWFQKLPAVKSPRWPHFLNDQSCPWKSLLKSPVQLACEAPQGWCLPLPGPHIAIGQVADSVLMTKIMMLTPANTGPRWGETLNSPDASANCKLRATTENLP